MYRLSAEQKRIVQDFATMADRDIAPHANRTDREAAFPSESIAALRAHGWS